MILARFDGDNPQKRPTVRSAVLHYDICFRTWISGSTPHPNPLTQGVRGVGGLANLIRASRKGEALRLPSPLEGEGLGVRGGTI